MADSASIVRDALTVTAVPLCHGAEALGCVQTNVKFEALSRDIRTFLEESSA
jgi:hypothetical protein